MLLYNLFYFPIQDKKVKQFWVVNQGDLLFFFLRYNFLFFGVTLLN